MAKVTSINSGGHRGKVLARRDQLVEENLGLVEAIAARIHRTLPPSFDLDDLIGSGYVGLIRAANQYRPKKHGGTPFSAYARILIRGAILDSVCRRNWDESTRPPLDQAPEPFLRADVIEITIDRQRLARRLTAAIDELPEQMREIIRMHYGREMMLTEVSEEFSFGPDRTRQLHREAIEKLRKSPRLRPLKPAA